MKTLFTLVLLGLAAATLSAQRTVAHVKINHPKLETDSIPDFTTAVRPYGKFHNTGFITKVSQDQVFELFPSGFTTKIYFQKPGDTELFFMNERPNLKKFQLAGNGTYYLVSTNGKGITFIHRLRMSGKFQVTQKAALVSL